MPHERYLVPLRTLEPKSAASLTDAALTPYRAITRALPFVPPDYPALVIGCGALGQFGVKILRLLSGADISPSRGFGVSAAFDFVVAESTLALSARSSSAALRT